MQSMYRLALEVIYIHRIDHTRVWKQEERQCVPEYPHVVDMVMWRKEVSNCDAWLIRMTILMCGSTNMVTSPQGPSSIRPGTTDWGELW